MKPVVIATFCLTLARAVLAAPPSADQTLAKADEIRNPQQDYVSLVKVTSYKPKKNPDISTFKTMVKGKDKSVVITLTPQIDRGRVLLMSGNNFWGYLPNVSKPLRISLQERLFGDVANGDLARANFTGDYTPTIIKTDTMAKKKYTVLDLKAKSEDVTYGRVVLWVEQANFRPLKAEFYAFSGRLLKTCSYEDYKQLGGQIRPAKLVMKDAVNKDQYSVIDLSEIKVAPLPDKYFTKDYMKTFQAE